MSTERCAEPQQLLQGHRKRLAALRLESGYPEEQFERLFGAPLHHVAEYTYVLPATRAENHAEAGGLLRLCVEAACSAFRMADGVFLGGPRVTDVRNHERDRVWRYTVFLGALLRPVGRCATHIRVVAKDCGDIWNPYQDPLWVWMRRTGTANLDIAWRRIDAKPMQAAAAWIAARILTSATLNYLQTADGAVQVLLQVLTGEASGRLCELVEDAHQATIDLDLTRMGGLRDIAVTGVQIEHRLLEALRSLIREKWTLNTPGGRLWHTREGVYLAWKAAVNDLSVRLRADGVSGVPRDADTIAELLVSHGVLTPNPQAVNGLRHYYRIIPQMKGVPKQPVEVVKLADLELVGIHLEGVDAIEVEFAGKEAAAHDKENAHAGAARKPKSEPQSLDLPWESSTPEAPAAATAPQIEASQTLQGSRAVPKQSSMLSPIDEKCVAELKRLNRFGDAGKVLRALAERLLLDPSFAHVVPLQDGVALAYPEAIAPFCKQPQDFVAACEAQGLLVADKAGGRGVLRTRLPAETGLPEQYLVLSPRVAKCLPMPVES